MAIDAYDTLGIALDATEEDIKKSFKRLSLLHHPDKVLAQSSKAKAEAEGKFNEIKLAKDILQDAERRRIYDTFGIDLGEERPEMEVWTIGMSTLIKPMGTCVLWTAVVRGGLWIISFTWPGRLLILAGLCVGVPCALNIPIGGWDFRSQELLVNVILPVGVINVVILLNAIWPLLGEALGVFYLVSEAVGVPMLIETWQVGAAAGFASLVVAWLARGWWFWIWGLEIILTIVMLVALVVAAGVVRLWTDAVQAQRGEALRTWRQGMRDSRKRLEDEIADLKSQLKAQDRGG